MNLLILSIFFSFFTMAQDFQDRFDEIINSCTQNRFMIKNGCERLTTNDKRYRELKISKAALMGPFGRGIDYFTDSEFKIKTCDKFEQSDRIEYAVYQMKIDPTIGKSSDCLKVCFVNCITSKLVTRSDCRNTLTFGTANHILKKGLGDCKQFAKIGKILFDAVGVEAYISASIDHAFIKVKIDDQWYSADPEYGDCVLYTYEDEKK